jgi:hypothetical protein
LQCRVDQYYTAASIFQQLQWLLRGRLTIKGGSSCSKENDGAAEGAEAGAAVDEAANLKGENFIKKKGGRFRQTLAN